MREKVIFPTNVPVTVALAYDEGLDVEGRFGDQVMYTLEDGRVMYVPPIVRKRIEERGIGKGQPFAICKAEKRNGSRRAIEWEVSSPGQPPDQQQVRPRGQVTNGSHSGAVGSGSQSAGGKPRPAGSTARQPKAVAAEANGEARVNGKVPAHNSPGHAPAGAAQPMNGHGAAMQSALISGVDAAIAAEEYAAAKGLSLRFTSEDVRAIALSLFIQQAREGGSKWQPL